MRETAAFVGQLNLLLENGGSDDWAGGICALLGVHVSANVSLTDESGQVLSEWLLPDRAVEAQTRYRLTYPIHAHNTQIGVLALSRSESDFAENDRISAAIALSVCTVMLRYTRERNRMEQRRRADAVKAVLNTLSFSELDASVHVFKALNGSEGLLVAGRIADQLGMTRSVVVNALRKLEGAGMIETRSLGMKGTYIRVLDNMLTGEIKKLARG